LNPEYAEMARRRIAGDAPLLSGEAYTPPARRAGRTARPQASRAIELYRRSALTREHLLAIRAAGVTDTGKARLTQTGTGKNTDDVQRLAAQAKEVLKGYYREFLTASTMDAALAAEADASKVPCPECGGRPGERGPAGWSCERCWGEGVILDYGPLFTEVVG
jgi:hypothetical protein